MLHNKNIIKNHIILYETLLKSKSDNIQNILIIGSQSDFNFNEYFKHSQIYYLDVLNRVPSQFINTNTKIYKTVFKSKIEEFMDDMFDKNIKFDIIIDDGIHTENTIRFYMDYYLEWITETGIILIEDVMDAETIELLKNLTPLDLKPFIEIYYIDHNKIKDVIFVINKSVRS
jgi:hypothetical protein